MAPFVKTPPTGKTVKEGDQITFFAEVTDSTADLATLAYVWDFGDETENKETPHVIGEPVSVEHVYAQNGDFSVTLKVMDKDGAEVEKIAKVVVQNVEPIIISAPESTTGNEGDVLSFSAMAEDFGQLTYTWDFGDGSNVSTGETVSHTFTSIQEDGFNVVLTVTDASGNEDVTSYNIKPAQKERPDLFISSLFKSSSITVSYTHLTLPTSDLV